MRQRRHDSIRSRALILGLITGLLGLAWPMAGAAGAAEPPAITTFWLVDADTDTRIGELTDYDRLVLPVLPDHLSIEAEANGETDSVIMRIEGVQTALENNAPYALASDTGGDFNPVPQLGNEGWITISAQPFSGPDAGGTVGTEVLLHLYRHDPDFVVTHGNDAGDTHPGDGVCTPTEVPTLGLTARTAAEATIPIRVGDKALTPIPTTTQPPPAPELEIVSAGSTSTPLRPVDELDLAIEKVDPGPCTLRAAIEEANALPGRQSILVPADRGPYVLEKGHLTVSDGVDIEGHGARPIIDGNQLSRIFYLTGDHLVNLNHVDLTNGSPGASERGGAIWVDNDTHLQMTDSIVRQSRANFGGGIYLQNGGDLSLRRSAIRDNIAGTPDDGIDGGGVTQRGGGIYNLKGVVTITDSSIFGNLAVRGGGLSNVGGTMRVENSSVIDNEALAIAGGIENHHAGEDKGNLHLAFATVAHNAAGTSNKPPESHRVGGGLYNTGWAYMASSILAGNTDGWEAGDPLHAPDCWSPDQYDFKSFRNNVVGVLNGNCDLGDYSSGSTSWIQFGSEASPLDPGLTGLYSWDHRYYRNLTADSVALDGGASASASLYPCADHDMRDRPRPVGDGCDIGAVERQ